MTPLTQILARRIAADGPIPVAEYMAECLLHPAHGYYTTQEPFGRQGDFITAPEISQMFGELAGLALAQCWLDQGAPAPFTLAELGPGRGTLMADILRATRGVPGFHAALRLHLVEASPRLRAAQAQALGQAAPEWHDSAQSLPEAPLYLIANEFFDALPIRQFQRAGSAWRERLVGLDTGGGLRFGLSDTVAPAALARRLEDTQEGDLIETCPAAVPVMHAIEARLCARGGAALIIDYGGWHSLGDTLQALRARESDPPLAHPGEADLTAHVDFEALRLAAPRLAASGLTEQGAWLARLGIGQRAEILAQRLSGPALEAHRAATRRLTAVEEMGRLFKVLGLARPGQSLPPGLEPAAKTTSA
ncbi:class I SAM-dependent methyltransferase [Allgaiera indica]|uniref:SAM-dependent methyltransferase, MidA family n=1 Tax=Allgaiera indica TaxID=765699 RepID=A0A1H2Z757_9RHOB|nr:SAM-dependent methyltransferase [Allgaiera indica]SDX13181.1 SAM-dependent methyltransferase, MidA family [Allgaiera indica]